MDSIEELGERWQKIYRVLSAGTRRQIIGSLLETDPDATLSLPEAASMPENRLDPEMLQTSLVHNHLPMMEQGEFIEWEQEPFCVTRGPRFDEVAGVLLAVRDSSEVPQHLKEGCYFCEQGMVSL